MAKFNQSHSSLPDASDNLTLQKDDSTVSAVKAKIIALEVIKFCPAKTTSSSHTHKPDYERRFTPTLTQNVRPSSLTVQSFKPAETQRDIFRSSVSPHPENVVMKSAMQGNTGISSKPSVSSASAMPVWIKYSEPDATTILKPETQRPNLPSLPKPHQGTKLSRPTPLQTQTAQKPKYIKTHGTQNKLQIQSNHPSRPKKRLPDVLTLQSPPTKPSRPPNVDIHQFRRNRSNLNHGPEMKIPCPVAPPPLPPPLCLRALSNNTSALGLNIHNDGECDIYGDVDDAEARISSLSQPTTDEDDLYDDIDVQNPLLPFEELDIYGNMGEDRLYEVN